MASRNSIFDAAHASASLQTAAIVQGYIPPRIWRSWNGVPRVGDEGGGGGDAGGIGSDGKCDQDRCEADQSKWEMIDGVCTFFLGMCHTTSDGLSYCAPEPTDCIDPTGDECMGSGGTSTQSGLSTTQTY